MTQIYDAEPSFKLSKNRKSRNLIISVDSTTGKSVGQKKDFLTMIEDDLNKNTFDELSPQFPMKQPDSSKILININD